MAKLTAAKVKSLSKIGKHADGSGLYLKVQAGGSKSWMLRTTIDGKRREIRLGGYPAITLAQARQRTAENKTAVANGINPIVEKRRAAMPTFSQAAQKFHAIHAKRWTNGRHSDSWLRTLETYAFPFIGDMALDRITKQDCLNILTPIWTDKPETARRVRQRMAATFDWATMNDYMLYNPADKRISRVLPTMPKVKQHMRFLPYQKVTAALDMIDETQAATASKLCLRFIILTACHYGEARYAKWDEIDLETAIWVKSQGKTFKGHRVPLSTAALDTLKQAQELSDGSGYIFPSPIKYDKALSENTLTDVLKSAKYSNTEHLHKYATVHSLVVSRKVV